MRLYLILRVLTDNARFSLYPVLPNQNLLNIKIIIIS